jgi:hypothetical protein
MVLYAASDSPLPEIAEDTPPPPLSIRPVTGTEELVRVHFSRPYAYFLGSHTGCSCGFQYGEGVDHDAEGRESVRALGAFLTSAVQSSGAIELFACWDGDEAEAPERVEIVSPSVFTGDADQFDLVERWFATVIPAVS